MKINVVSIIVAYNKEDDVLKCIEKVSEETKHPIVVVDNSSPPMERAIKKIKDLQSSIYYLKSKKNYGSAKGFSIGMRFAIEELNADWIWLHDQDGFPSKECFKYLYEGLQFGGQIGIVAPVIRTIERADIHDGFRAKVNVFGYPVSLDNHRLGRPGWNELDLVGSAGIMVSANCIKEVGTYDCNFFVGYEDYEFSQRVRKNGWRILLIENADYFHPDLYKKYKLRNKSYSGGIIDWIKPLYMPLKSRDGGSKVKELTINLIRYRRIPFAAVSIVYSLLLNVFRKGPRSYREQVSNFIREVRSGVSTSVKSLENWKEDVVIVSKYKGDKLE